MRKGKFTNEEILKKAIEKAVENKYPSCFPLELFAGRNFDNQILLHSYDNFNNLSSETHIEIHYYSIIFSHSFAKAFWGEGIQWFCMYCGHLEPIEVTYQGKCKHCSHDAESLSSWTFRLQKMVLEEEPLKYLKKFL